jgi:biotin operon repressor
MTNQLNWERIKIMNDLIKSSTTGTPEEFAKKLGISKSHLSHQIEVMKELGLNIAYSRTRNTYYYQDNKELQITISVKLLSDNDMAEIYGGMLNSTSLLFYNNKEI